MTIRFGIAELVQTACLWEVTARKVGNVHRYADFAETSYFDFMLSAAVIAPHFHESSPMGVTINRAVRATVKAVGQNTNLGMILLLAPLACADQSLPLCEAVDRVLKNLTVDDARQVYEAIRLAKPGGLGEAAREDVRSEPTVTLLEAMNLAADRDQIARQYATAYQDIFDFGIPTFLKALQQFGAVEAAIIDLQIRWLAREPDTLIARKNGRELAGIVREKAAKVMELGSLATHEGRTAGVQLDQYLRAQGNKLNPGSTADLIAACLFGALRENNVMPSTPFRWAVPDWL